MPRFLKIIFYFLIFIFTYVLFVYWMFPMETVKTRIITTAEKTLGPDYIIEIEDIATYRLSGVKLYELAIFQKIEGEKTPLFDADTVKARASLLSLLLGSPKINFHAKSGNTRISGRAQNVEGGWKIDSSFKNLDLSRINIVRRKSGLNVSSLIHGDIGLVYNPQQPLRTSGDISLEFDKLLLKKSEVSLGEMGTFPLPNLSLAGPKSVLTAKIQKGSINVQPLRLKGKDFLFELKGRVFLAKEVSKYRMNLKGEIQFPPDLWKLVEQNIPDTFLNNLKKQKSGDESFPLSVAGQLGSPQIYSGSLKIYPIRITELF